MYEKVCAKKKWSMEIISISRSEAGGFKVIFSVSGLKYTLILNLSQVFTVFKESLIQRHKEEYIHQQQQSTVLPEAEEIDLEIKDSDLRVDVFRSGGPGGQSVILLIVQLGLHISPTNIVVSQQDEKSQHKNKAKALKILRARVYEAEKRKKDKERSENRKSQIGSGDRSERIRTYNFPQGRITDHRINLTLHKLDEFLNGEIHDEVNESLRLKEQDLQLADLN